MNLQEHIRKVLREEKLKQNLKQQIKNFGVEDTISLVGDFYNLCLLLNIETPMDFLHLFDDLDVVRSKEDEDLILFRYKPNYNFMVYDKKNEKVNIDYDEIWSFLEDGFGLSNEEIQGLTGKWLDEVYNLRGVIIYIQEFISVFKMD